MIVPIVDIIVIKDKTLNTHKLALRINRYLQANSTNECLEWIGKAKTDFGYGRLTAGRSINLKAHRAVWLLTKGPIPEGLNVLHSCDNPPCCNPAHLFLGTNKDNMDDKQRKGRGINPPIHLGEKHHNATLTEEKVRIIRATSFLKKGDKSKLARELGISQKNVYDVIHNKVWNHVK